MAHGFRHESSQDLASLISGEADSGSLDRLFVACQRELHAAAAGLMRHERAGHTLQPTALVNEAYLRLFRAENLPVAGHAHFVNLVARTMRQVLVEHARRRKAQKRGGDRQMVTLTGLSDPDAENVVDLLELDEALEKLAALDERTAKVVDLRIFGGMTMEEIALILGLTRRTVQKDWRFALVWLRRELAI